MTEFAYNILRSLRASTISSVVDRLWPLFHKDPVAYFPAEMIHQIFSYLSPANLLEASKVSKGWRNRVLDGRLWREKFRMEGWVLNTEEINRFEQRYNGQRDGVFASPIKGAPSRRSDGRNRAVRQSKGQGRPIQHRGTRSLFSPSAKSGAARLGDTIRVKGKEVLNMTLDENMTDPSDSPRSSKGKGRADNASQLEFSDSFESSDSDSSNGRSVNFTDRESNLPSEPNYPPSTVPDDPLVLAGPTGYSSLNYHHLFKQKRKLEDNWNAGKYINFQLPHRDYPQDAHTECVYTIQYAGKYLVSGSRDRTLRIWDLDTQRLARRPLEGHTGSVLCLQFDNSEDEDIIISGSSDTHVILWQFSTGRMIRQLTNAHRESVLNLRFDKRYLVTCSKDKTIKVWSRHQLKPGDRDYPVKGIKGGGMCPAYIVDASSIPAALKFGPRKPDQLMYLEPYTHLMTLDLHGAAVNAIQIYENQLVSASGDRCLRVWDIHTGECTTKIEAHTKGIACVQYDGRRIVSGSSDNTIRIWDPINRVEVARLEGHSRLVRTIQAAFADVPGGRERLEAEADEVTRQFKIAKEAGLIPQPSRRDPPPVPGSRRPKDLRAINAKIPPSGGGGRWSHIVSGSYDETVIIWKKTADDEWVIGNRLRQEEALTAAGPALPSRYEHDPLGGQDDQAGPVNPPQALSITPQQTNQATSSTNPPHPGNQAAPPNTNNIQNTMNKPPQAAVPGQLAPLPAAFPMVTRLPANAHGQVPPGAPPNGAQPNARVFKLQFDARRIICCSQDPKIVGWDFANGDEQIMECSKFFAAPQ